ncbi:MAG: terminase gpA endonuclease subunit, partial [Clostridia bacterium]
QGKESILYATSIEKSGPRYMHFPLDYRSGYDMEYFRGLISEQMVFHRRGGQSAIAWEKIYDRNEPLDCRNYARAAFRYFNWHFEKYEQALSGEKTEASVITQAQAKAKKQNHIISNGITV